MLYKYYQNTIQLPHVYLFIPAYIYYLYIEQQKSGVKLNVHTYLAKKAYSDSN